MISRFLKFNENFFVYFLVNFTVFVGNGRTDLTYVKNYYDTRYHKNYDLQGKSLILQIG